MLKCHNKKCLVYGKKKEKEKNTKFDLSGTKPAPLIRTDIDK